MCVGKQEGMGGFPVENRVECQNIMIKGGEGFVLFAGFGSGIQKEWEAQESWSGIREIGISTVSWELTYTGSQFRSTDMHMEQNCLVPPEMW